MSAFKQKFARLGATAGVLVGATAGLLAVGGATASNAAASCTAGTMEGQGSSLQREAQEKIWEPAWIAASCGVNANPKVTYTATSSGKGLKAWGYTGGGPVTTSIAFVGTDDGPNSEQIAAAKKAAKEATGNEANTVIVPVVQTAIAVIVHPPAGCTLPTITNAHLNEAFSGKAETWGAIGAIDGSGKECKSEVPLKRVVRKEGSGTTYQFKNYLAKVQGWDESLPPVERSKNEALPCIGAPSKWSALETIGAPPVEAPNTEWPSCGTIGVISAEGGGGVSKEVVKVEGSIGYAALPDAKAAGATTVKVQGGNVGGKAFFNAPEVGTEEANCSKSRYDVPAAARGVGASGIDVDWSQVFGGNPIIVGSYPICTLTYDLGWHSYANAGFGSTLGTSVREYFERILSTGAGSTPHWYAAVPSIPTEETVDVRTAANLAVAAVN